MMRSDPIHAIVAPFLPTRRRRALRGRNGLGLLLAALCALPGCAVGPDYTRPKTPAFAAQPFVAARLVVDATADADPNWWRLYDDPLLNGLVGDALAANTDLRIVNLERVRASLRGAKSDRLPQMTIDASTKYNRLPNYQTLPARTVSSAMSTPASTSPTSICSVG